MENRKAVTIALLLMAVASQAQTNLVNKPFADMDRHGVTFSLDFSSDLFGASGAKPASETSQQWLDLSSRIELARVSSRFKGTRVFVSLHLNGAINSNLGGAVQSISGLQTAPGVHLPEFWLEHETSSWSTFRIGKIDANRDFGVTENAGFFLNSTQGYDPTFIALPNYNDTRTGVEVLLHPRRLAFNLAVFSPAGGRGVLLMQEASYRWSLRNNPGRLAAGVWRVTGKMLSIDGDDRDGARGHYAIAEQSLWHNERDSSHQPQTLSVFGQIGTAPATFSLFTSHLGGGLLWKAAIVCRENDAIGFAISHGHLSWIPSAPDPRNENAWEAFYRIQVRPTLSFTPDLQYIDGPGGARRSLVAVGARMTLNLHSGTE